MRKDIPPQQLRPRSADEANSSELHIPVLLEEVVRLLAPEKGETYLDLTAGFGGHARRIVTAIGDASHATLVDRDSFALEHLADMQEAGARLIKGDFASVAEQLVEEGRRFDMILADLGVSSPQLDKPERGFSFQRSGPLDMRMDQTQALSAADVINRWSEVELVEILQDYGEEHPGSARRIARAIVDARPLNTTEELARLIERTQRGPRSKIHPATRPFQAVRIAVNQELTQLERLLDVLPRLLNKGGKGAIISFHSLEDRLVKRAFREASYGYEATLRELTASAINGATTDVHNPRARSAKLRVAVKI